MVSFDSRLIFERMKEVTGGKSDKDLSVFLNVPATTLANWKNRNNLPIEVILSFVQEHNISLDWLLIGEKQSEKLSDLQNLVLKAFDGLGEGAKIEAISLLNNLSKGTHSTATIQQTSGDNGINAGRDVNMNKDTDQSVVGR